MKNILSLCLQAIKILMIKAVIWGDAILSPKCDAILSPKAILTFIGGLILYGAVTGFLGAFMGAAGPNGGYSAFFIGLGWWIAFICGVGLLLYSPLYISILLYRKQRHKSPEERNYTGSRICLIIFLGFIFIPMLLAGLKKEKERQESQERLEMAHAKAMIIPPGFLAPSAESIPPDFTKDNNSYFFTKESYILDYRRQDRAYLRFSESKGLCNLEFIKENPFIQDFEYQGTKGQITKGHITNNGVNGPRVKLLYVDLISGLRWQDQEKCLVIETNAPDIQPEQLIKLLHTMVRSQ